MIEKVIMAGAGGQGVIALGKLLARAMMEEGREVTFFPAYGAEVRGGTAHGHLTISDNEIYSPIVERADTLIIMNQPSMNKFSHCLKEGGLLILNSSMAKSENCNRGDKKVRLFEVPATRLANELGNTLVGNMIMLGAYNKLKKFLDFEKLLQYIEYAFEEKGEKTVGLNKEAVLKGAAFIEGL